MELHVNVISISDHVLKELHRENNCSSCKFVSKEATHHGGGFFIDTVIFKEDDKFFRFLAISYLDDEYMTFTQPYEVFQKEYNYTINTYTSWIKD